MITLIVSLATIVLLVLLAYWKLIYIRIEGDSMLPTYRSGERAIVVRRKPHHPYKKGDVVLLYSPDGRPVMKRIETSEVHHGHRHYYVLGDNPGVSRDSRHYGHAEQGALIGTVHPNRTKQ